MKPFVRLALFFAAGLLIYLLDLAFSADADQRDIYLSDRELRGLTDVWAIQVGREPTDDELRRIIDNRVEEEVLYREALRLGLDRDDRIIRRRLAQKLTFLKQGALAEPPEAQVLARYYDDNKDRYFVPPQYSFTHLFFSTEKADAPGRAQAALADLLYGKGGRGAEAVASDPFFLGGDFADRSADSIARVFGSHFALSLEMLQLSRWAGPLTSSYGSHLVLLQARKAGLQQPYAEVQQQVLTDYMAEANERAVRDYINQVKSEYRVIVEPAP